MSCDVAASAFILMAAFAPARAAHPPQFGLSAPRLIAVSNVQGPPGERLSGNRLAGEPLYADIIGRARTLKAQAEAYRKGADALRPLPGFEDFKARAAALSDLDMKGHMDLAARGTDGDLKCILKGISQDLPKRLTEVAAAATAPARDAALRDLVYLLNDNVEVITAPPAPPV